MARPSPIEVNGLKIESRIVAPVSKGAKILRAEVVATAPPRWTGPFELFVYNPGDRHGTGGFVVNGTHRARADAVIHPDVANGDIRIYGRASRFETADEEITVSGAIAVHYSTNIFHVKLEKPVTVTTPSGLRVTFPEQVLGVYSGPPYATGKERLRLKGRMPRQGRVAAFGSRVPSELDPRQISVRPIEEQSYFPEIPDPSKDGDLEVWFDHPGGKPGPIAPLTFKIRHRADIEVIPFAVIATP
jgi:hypothetical protein